MFEVLDVIFMMIWLLVFILLVIAECLFCIQLQELLKLHKKIKKEYALSTNNGHNGHPGRLIKDVEKDLVNLRIQIISWGCIAIAGAYAILDCFITHII